MLSAPFPRFLTARILGVFLLAVLTGGCPTRNEILLSADAGDRGDAADAGDAGRQADGDAQSDGPPGISIVSPAALTYVAGVVRVEVNVTGGMTTEVELLRNDTSWQTLSGPPFVYNWDTASVPDGNYILTARATVSEQVVTSAPVTVSVDHTPPTVMTLSPTRGNTAVSLKDPITVTFSEPVLATTVTNNSVQLSVNGTSIASSSILASDAQSLAIAVANPKALSLPAAFTATVSTTITDRAGNALVPVVPPWTWSVPAWITLPPLPTEMPPRLAIDAAGAPPSRCDQASGGVRR